ncbi:TolC family protein [Sinomicrobium kalidii]|uniref:TolC family protein n=1 Tax=Sinomicrobium kalidii TaxID=2900738 RepID=UPI001E2D9798|nr:TolC family protein [Sinomicrobium kalidii]UGU14839.1 TolC family protein [Sinomicrobium kalidii]
MKTRIILLTFFLTACFAYSQPKKWTLKACIDYAIKHNINVQQSELDTKDAKIDKSDAIGNFLPALNVGASHSWNIGLNQNITTGLLENQTTQFTSFQGTVRVDVFKGLQNVNTLRRANLSILANRYKLEDMKDDISLSVANGYLQILFSRENLEVAKAQYAVTEQDLKKTRELVESGVVPKGDLLEIEATAANQEQQIVNAENELRLSRIALAQLLLIDDYENFDVADEDFMLPESGILDHSPKNIYRKALTFRNDIKFSKTNVELAEKDLDIAKGALLPTLSAFYGYDTRISYQDRAVGTGDFELVPIGVVPSTQEEVVTPRELTEISGPQPFFDQWTTNDGHSYGLQLNIPILNGFSAKNNVKRSEVNLERTKNQLEQDKLDLDNAIHQAWNDTRAAYKSYEAAGKALEARKEAHNYARERYNVGLMSSFDFAQAQARVDNAEAEFVRTKYDYIFKLKVLEFYFGIPLDEL